MADKSRGLVISNKTAIILACIFFAIYFLTIEILSFDIVLRGAFNDIFQAIFSFATSFILYLISKKLKSNYPKQAKTWLLFSVAVFFFAIGGII